MSDAVAKRVIEIIAEHAVLEAGDITMDSTPEELGIDSLGMVESIFAIEEAFDIEIPFNANEPEKSDFDITCVRAMVGAVEQLVSNKGD